MSKSSPPPGTGDLFPADVTAWRELEDIARKTFTLYGYGEIRTPIFEFTEVFQRGLGNETEVVQKEMYTFQDRGGRSLTLRPEGTAGVMRALSGTEAMNGVEQRVFYMGPMFRGERPAAGRRRQFHQIGVENAGKVVPELDAENIAMLSQFLNAAGAGGFELLINTRGVKEDRKPAEDALREHFAQHISDMCEDCRNRLERNVWRILDCKQECCRPFINTAPDAASLFGQGSRDYFNRVCDTLAALDVNFKVEPRLVRGLDYYVHTVFELTHTALGGQNAIAGGGRYELTVPGFNRPVQGVGFAAGMERLLMVREAQGRLGAAPDVPAIFLISLGERAMTQNIRLAAALRNLGIPAAIEYEAKSMKSQMRSADRLKAEHVLILGDSELDAGAAILKKMADGTQVTVPINAEKIQEALR